MSLLIIAVFVGIIHLVRPTAGKKTAASGMDYAKIHVEKPQITELLLTKNENSRPATPLETVRGVVIHYTANPGTDARANRNYFESRKDCPDESGYKVSSHFIIGLDGTIVQCIPEDEVAYASNERNSDTISIECCHPDKSGKFTPETYQSLIKLTAYLCDSYKIEMEQIIRHYDVTKKMCPKYYVRHPAAWKSLKKDVASYLTEHMLRD